jgi:3-oxoacyl-[acyl-carrier protein] reductase
MSKLAGRVALVTGASKGFGAAIAKGLAAEGAAVVVNYSSDKAGADRTVAEITGDGGRAVAVQASVSNANDVKRLLEVVASSFEKLDILVNNAGVYTFGPLEEFEESEFHRQFSTNVLGCLLVTRACLPLLGEGGGTVINIGTAGTTLNLSGTVLYTATKGALDSITRVLANELGPKKIRVNSVNAGIAFTEGVTSMGMTSETDFVMNLTGRTPLGRVGKPEDVADVVVFLATDSARWVTGQHIQASGGLR